MKYLNLALTIGVLLCSVATRTQAQEAATNENKEVQPAAAEPNKAHRGPPRVIIGG